MTFYPFPERLRNASYDMARGNFGLWYNKFIPLSDEHGLSPSNGAGEKTKPVEYYADQYKKSRQQGRVSSLLQKRHDGLDDFLYAFVASNYEPILFAATLKTPLITGIGESHPHEVSMVFDHNLGIPYLPASGIKGIARFAHTLSIWRSGVPDAFMGQDREGESVFKDDEYEPIYALFGNQKNRGKAIFLDAYPQDVPELRVDIMNPHYGDYYSDEKKKTPPADYLSPNPIKFLTVAPGTTFIFRAVAEKKGDLPDKVRLSLIKALTEEGVGAKTSVGYGRFVLDDEAAQAWIERRRKKQQEEENRRFPWRSQLDRIKAISDWGSFKQLVLDNEALSPYREEKEVAEAVFSKAKEVRETWLKNWDISRDELIAKWLEPAGVGWESLAMESEALEKRGSEEYRKVDQLGDWNVFKSSKIDPSRLPEDALRLLAKKMESWGCNERKAKEDKRQAYKRVRDLLRRA